MSTSTVAASTSVRARARPRASRPPRASPSSDLRDVERDVANEGAARVRVSRAFIADLDADAPRRALEYVSLPANEYLSLIHI